MGREVVVAITNGHLDFGPWEQIFYGEFDGRRRKLVLIKIIGEWPDQQFPYKLYIEEYPGNFLGLGVQENQEKWPGPENKVEQALTTTTTE